MLEFRVLGSLEVLQDGETLRLGGQKGVALLALLLIQANHVVLTDVLIDALWGERPPPTAKTSIQNLVAQFRRLLGPDCLETRGPAYVLLVEPDQVDSIRFEALVMQAHGESADERVKTLETALQLWRGPAYSDVFYESFAQGEIARLEELRVAAFEDLYSARLELGQTVELVPKLRSLVESHPYRERLRRQLMLALYRSGRGVDALRTFIEWRVRLEEEWDMKPGHAIERTADDIRQLSPRLDEVIALGRVGRRRSVRPNSPARDPLAELDVDQAMTVLAAVEAVANGEADRLDELPEDRIASIDAALLDSWQFEGG